MKNIKKFMSLVATCFFLQTANAQVSNPDTMIHKVFATLKAKDEKAFVALYPDATQFSKMMRTVMEQMFKSEAMQKMMAMDEKSKNMNFDSLISAEVSKLQDPGVFAEMEKKFVQSFQKIIEKGEQKGVKWSDAKLTTYTMDSVSLDEEDMEMFSGSGIKNMKGVIDFSVGDSAYQMSYSKIVYLPAEGGWFGGEFPQVVRKGESLEEDQEIMKDEETIRSDSTSYADPKDRSIIEKKKTKAKTPTSKTKTKTKAKTPARKPGTKS